MYFKLVEIGDCMATKNRYNSRSLNSRQTDSVFNRLFSFDMALPQLNTLASWLTSSWFLDFSRFTSSVKSSKRLFFLNLDLFADSRFDIVRFLFLSSTGASNSFEPLGLSDVSDWRNSKISVISSPVMVASSKQIRTGSKLVEDIAFSGKIYIRYSTKPIIGMINFVRMRSKRGRGSVTWTMCGYL